MQIALKKSKQKVGVDLINKGGVAIKGRSQSAIEIVQVVTTRQGLDRALNRKFPER